MRWGDGRGEGECGVSVCLQVSVPPHLAWHALCGGGRVGWVAQRAALIPTPKKHLTGDGDGDRDRDKDGAGRQANKQTERWITGWPRGLG